MNTKQTSAYVSRTFKTVSRRIAAACGVAVFGLLALAFAPSAMADSWTVRGSVHVRHQLTALVDRYYLDRGVIEYSLENGYPNPTVPLVGVEIMVAARSKFAGSYDANPFWKSWGTDEADEDGKFSVSETAGSPRQIRVQIRFKSDDVVIRDADGLDDSAKWHTIYQAERNSGTIDLGDLIFESGGAQDLNDADAREQADLWVLARLLRKTMKDFGYPFQKTLTIEQGYHTGPRSYCNPFDNVVHLHEDDFETSTVIHECMHAWLFEHMDGEDNLLTQLMEGSTHCLQNDGESWVAFVEGFSEFCEGMLGELMFGWNTKLPFTHFWLYSPNWEGCEDGTSDLDRLERHCAGWTALFRLVTTPDVCLYDFNGGGTNVEPIGDASPSSFDINFAMFLTRYVDPNIDFVGVLDAITGGSATGKLDRDDMNFQDFLERVVAFNEAPAGSVDAWLLLLTPSLYDATQPTDVFSPNTLSPGSILR